MEALKLHVLNYKEANELIRKYFRECLPTINDNNLYMLRKLCMYISMVYFIMIIISKLVLSDYKFFLPDLLVIPLIMVYFNINLYTMKHRGQISTGKTAAICCTFYFILGVILAIIDVYKAPAGQAIWLPIAVMALPMIFIDRIYKYAFEEMVVLSILLILSYIHKSHEVFLRDVYIALAAYVISIFSARIILEMRARETLAMAEVTRLSALDKLTHVLNKNALIDRIQNYFDRKSPEEFCSICIIDLDDFKLVNDNLGHNAGDLLLEKVGQLLIENFRAYDIIGRYGGDEFIVVMPRMADVSILVSRCKALQMFINDLDVGGGHSITASIGAVICSGVVKYETIFAMADDALYKSKIQGKNCCTTWVYNNEIIDKDILLLMSEERDEGVDRLFEGEGAHFHILHTTNDDQAICRLSQYQEQVKIILTGIDIEKGTGLFLLKYIKKREGFSNIPVLAIVNNQKDAAFARELKADEVISIDSSDQEFKKAISKLVDKYKQAFLKKLS